MNPNPPAVPFFDVLVVGAGPAGMMAAISSSHHGARVAILDQLDRPGLKLLATGGGRCNVTNTLDDASFMEQFGKNGRFMQPALKTMNGSGLRAFLAEHGVPTVSPDGFHVYPASNTSASVLQALWPLCSGQNVKRYLGTEAKSLRIENESVIGIETESGPIAAQTVVLTTGGKSYPNLGATGSGYRLAAQAGHMIVPPLPVLVPLVTRETWPGRLSGVSLRQVHVWIDLPRRQKAGCTGDLLFTRTGISGPAILDLSREVVPLLQKHGDVPLRVDLQPGTSAEQWNARFDEWPSAHGRKKILTLLDQHLPASLARTILQLAGVAEDTTAAAFSRLQRDAVLERITQLPLTVRSAGGFDNAMVTRGGIRLREVDPKTLQSRKVGGLYFAGEVLDLDGPCGGYNLQWAFSSGWLAGSSAASHPSEPGDPPRISPNAGPGPVPA